MPRTRSLEDVRGFLRERLEAEPTAHELAVVGMPPAPAPG
jgi:hypothetical protein